jgi:hypothetical protein
MLIAFRILLCFVALTVCMALLVDSAHSKRRSKQPRVQQPAAAAVQQKANEDQRGTEKSPLIVKTIPTPKSDEERAEEAKERERLAQIERNKEKSDADLVKYTAELSKFTERLFYATGALVVATIGLLAFAAIQSRDVKRQLSGMQASINLARDEFIASHRPVMKVKLVNLVQIEDERAGVQFTVVNMGQTVAHVTGSCAKADFFGETDWPHPDDYGVDNVIPPGRFENGVTGTYTISTVHPVGLMAIHAGEAEATLQLRFYGYIVYSDDSGNLRTTYFCRRYNPRWDRFDPVDRTDYDSAD